MKPSTQFEEFVVGKLTRIDEVLTEHNAQTADISRELNDLKKWQLQVIGAVKVICFSVAAGILGFIYKTFM